MIYITFHPDGPAICTQSLLYSGLSTLKFYRKNVVRIFAFLHKPIFLVLHFKTTEQALNFASECAANVLIDFIFCFKSTKLCGCHMTEPRRGLCDFRGKWLPWVLCSQWADPFNCITTLGNWSFTCVFFSFFSICCLHDIQCITWNTLAVSNQTTYKNETGYIVQLAVNEDGCLSIFK